MTSTFRFYAELNAFLAPERRGRDFAAVCAEAATTKHMIEALGVPHTEVEAILVNGEPAGFSRLLRDGDRVAVYPHFTALPVPTAPPLRPALTGAPRFIADAHLGGLARLLRMSGFDTLYRNDYADAEIAAIADREERVVLTRDRELLKLRHVTHGCYVHALHPPLQFREIVERLALAEHLRPFSRCLECNAALQPIDKALVIERLPPQVQAHYETFTTCDQCGRIYWPGSHWRRMKALLEGALPGNGANGSRNTLSAP